jgi:hypothetical protein
MNYHNANSLGAQSEEQAKKDNWHRMDCLAANQLRVEHDTEKLKKWFASQNEEWQAARKARFTSRLNERGRQFENNYRY